ncbi:MAG: orotidine-5'-phosphate decarboxylase [Bacteroidia bacterium]|nr:orotidine-5'-phosphate decarboxylase [Bacteroidia bacterium]
MTLSEIISFIKEKKTCLCVGLDPDMEKIPSFLLEYDDPIFEFNKRIADAVAEHCIAFKPNLAFYEAYGSTGYAALEKTIQYLKINYPHHFLIADAKRGDIGSTSERYAHAFFKKLNADAITIAPYMGRDSVEPFLKYPGKFAIILGLTSNEGAVDFQLDRGKEGELFKHVLKVSSSWGTPENMMFVIGATKSEYLSEVRKIIPNHFLLIPGIGAQGGDLENVFRYGKNDNIGLIINISRSIIYASSDEHFAMKAAEKAKAYSELISKYI